MTQMDPSGNPFGSNTGVLAPGLHREDGIADASIMPNVTSGNTMAPCVVIGERAAEIIKMAHRI